MNHNTVEKKIIPGFSRYVASSDGKIFNDETGKEISQILNDGYCHVAILNDNDVSMTVSVHRLIAISFIPNPFGFCDVDHINRKRNDNRIENLRWIDRSGNLSNTIKQRVLNTKCGGREFYINTPFPEKYYKAICNLARLNMRSKGRQVMHMVIESIVLEER